MAKQMSHKILVKNDSYVNNEIKLIKKKVIYIQLLKFVQLFFKKYGF